jgi:hypothetical protein
VNERRLAGAVVDYVGPSRWRCHGETLDDAGEAIGF